MKNKFWKYFMLLLLFIIVSNLIILLYVKISTKNKIFSDLKDISKGKKVAVILGASVKNEEPSHMLRDRLDAGISLYKNNKVSKIIMSGDGRTEEYNEVRVMKKYAISKGVPKEDIFIDGDGLNTSKSIENIKNNYNKEDEYVIVSQRFHLSRSLLLADRYEVKAIAYQAEDKKYVDLTYLEIREAMAILKDFYKTLI